MAAVLNENLMAVIDIGDNECMERSAHGGHREAERSVASCWCRAAVWPWERWSWSLNCDRKKTHPYTHNRNSFIVLNHQLRGLVSSWRFSIGSVGSSWVISSCWWPSLPVATPSKVYWRHYYFRFCLLKHFRKNIDKFLQLYSHAIS